MSRLVVLFAALVSTLTVSIGYADPPDSPNVPPPCTTDPCVVPYTTLSQTLPGVDQTVPIPRLIDGTYQVCALSHCTGVVIIQPAGSARIVVPSYTVSWFVPGLFAQFNGGVDVRVLTPPGPLLPVVSPMTPPGVTTSQPPPGLCVFDDHVTPIYRCL